MDIFGNDASRSLLPRDGSATYYGIIFTPEESSEILDDLLAMIPWRHDEVVMFGKHIVTARKIAWVADEGVRYTYSGKSREPVAWTRGLLKLKAVCEQKTESEYNSCLLNLYHNGDEGMGWHSDDERSIVPHSSIACLSFGAIRKFSFKHKRTKETVSIELENGSLLNMSGATQENWRHQLVKSKKISEPRVSLTFRRMLSMRRADKK